MLVKIFPNPASNEINIELKDHTENTLLEMYNSKGQMVLKSIIYGSSNIIDINGLLPGLYLINLTNSMFYQKIN